MSKLVLLKGLDENALSAALSIEGSAMVLLQDAVYMARECPQVKEALKYSWEQHKEKLTEN